MTLRTWFRIHALCDAPFAIPLVVAPLWFIPLLTGEQRVGPVAVDFARLAGLAYVLIAMLTWGASSLRDRAARLMIARVFCVYEALGVLVGLTVQFPAHHDIARWLTVGFFAVFAAGYAWFGFLKPERG